MSSAFVNPLAPKKSGVIESARRIKNWTRACLKIDDATIISVNELACHLPGCPPKETVILVMAGPNDTTQFSIHKTIADVTFEDVSLMATDVQDHG
ncbi:hypothetical protein [Martelella mediterranea]|uniref:Nitrate reductase n=1 Tax=Martelella mediterranea DSM 17316 TaxID=1122214 RepID=A0A1U9YVS2_9HYPH|nr:hypothetical protein [Martelella mediterranea]AQZ49536.1 hypothetical protein Mame_00153 [Martelella mediterranea DSM 17316]